MKMIRAESTALIFNEVTIWKYVQDREVLFLYRKFKNRGT